MKICSLASGSKGNCLYLETGDTRVLIDAGLSLRETLLRMDAVGIDASRIHAVLVTHEHIDHIRAPVRLRASSGCRLLPAIWCAPRLRGCRFLNLESNHDVEMMMNGPYPWELKQRIKSRHMHISNEESLELLHELAHEGLEALVMAHLSEVNNNPEHVVRTTRAFLSGLNTCAPRIVIGDPCKASNMIKFEF